MVALVHACSALDAQGTGYVRLPVLDLVRRFAAAIGREVHLRHDLAILQSLDDAMLSDIGLSRGEIDDVVRHGRSLRP